MHDDIIDMRNFGVLSGVLCTLSMHIKNARIGTPFVLVVSGSLAIRYVIIHQRAFLHYKSIIS